MRTPASASSARPKPDILIPSASRTLSIGTTGSSTKHSYDVDFDDALKLRAFMETRRGILADVDALPDDADEETRMQFIETLSGRVESAADTILGPGAYAEIFDGKRSFFGGLALLTEIEKFVGPAYDAAFSKYAPKPE